MCVIHDWLSVMQNPYKGHIFCSLHLHQACHGAARKAKPSSSENRL